MSGLRATLSSREHLHSIEAALVDYGEIIRRSRDIPDRVVEVLQTLETIEYTVRKKNDQRRIRREALPNAVATVIDDRNDLQQLVDEIRVELQRITSTESHSDKLITHTKAVIDSLEAVEMFIRPKGKAKLHFTQLQPRIAAIFTRYDLLDRFVEDVQNQIGRTTNAPLRFDSIVQQIKAIIDSLEALEVFIRPQGHKKLPFTDLQPQVEYLMQDAYAKSNSNEHLGILTSIASIIDPSSAQESFQDLPLKIQTICDNQASNTKGITPKSTSVIESLESKLQDLQQRNVELENNVRQSKAALDRAFEQAEQIRGLQRRNQELEQEVKESRASFDNVFEQAENHRKNLVVKHDNEIQALKEGHDRALNLLRSEKDSAIENQEKANGQKIEQIIAKQEEELRKREGNWLQALSKAEEAHKKNMAVEKAAYKAETERVWQQHAKDLDQQKLSHQEEKKQTRIRHRSEKENLQTQIQELGINHQANLKRQREESDTLIRKTNTEWTEKLAAEVQQHEQSRKNHKSQLKALEAQWNHKLAQQEELHTNAMRSSKQEMQQQLASLQQTHKIQTEEEKKKTAETAQTLRDQLAQAKDDHRAEVIEWTQTLSAEKDRSVEKLKETEEKHKSAIEMHKRQSQKAMEAVRRDRDKLQDLLLKQKPYDGITDNEVLRGVASKDGKLAIIGFSTVVSKVTAFADWEWREDRKVWPAHTMMSFAGSKQRRLKKLILGDAIWTTLFLLIFCSPFRMIGEAGRNCEEEWNKLFGSDDEEMNNEYNWPTPTATSEKYRWDTCQATLDALTKPSSPYEPLRASFLKHQQAFNEQFLEALSAYVELTEKRKQELLKFLIDTVRMWLVFCTQRYRVRLILPGSSERDPNKRIILAQEQKDLEFTVVPKLQRHGDPHGVQLHEISVIAGFNGKVATMQETL